MASRLAVVFTNASASAPLAVSMLQLPVERVSNEIDVTAIAGGAVAVAHPAFGESSIALERTHVSGRRLWIAGVPIAPGRSIDALLGAAMSSALDDAIDALASLDGVFAAVVWDDEAGRLAIVTDFAGMQPLYVLQTPRTLAFATTIAALAALEAAAPDPAGWGAFVSFGHFVGDRTSVCGVRRVDGASIIEYRPATGTLTSRTYWRWPEPDHRLAAIDTGELLAALTAGIDAYAAHRTDGTLLLSGGFESRLLAAILGGSGRAPAALTVKNPYEHHEIDGRFAALVARALGLPMRTVTPAPDFFSTPAFRDYVRLNEVATTSVNLFIAHVCDEIVRSGAAAVWDGVGYGIVIKDKSAPDFATFLKKAAKGPESAAWRAARRVFSRSFADAMAEGAADSVRRERAQCLDGPSGIAQFFVRNRARNRTTPNGAKVYAQYVLPFMPGFTRAFYQRAAAIPPACKRDDALYRLMLERHFPKVARLPICSAGHLLPGTAGPGWTYRWLSARSRIVEHPRVGDWMRRAGISPSPAPSRFVEAAVRDADPDDPWLNADGVRALRRTPPTGAVEDTAARELLFYWAAWRSAFEAAGAIVS